MALKRASRNTNGYRNSLALWFLLVALPLSAAHALPEAELSPAIQAALSRPSLKHGISGVLVQSLRDGHTLYAQNAGTALMPASNMKIITASLGLRALGPEYRFRTLLAQQGEVKEGVLDGDLVLKGFGDPTLTTADLRAFVEAARAHGIRRVSGGVVVDDTFFSCPRIGVGWSWEYLEDYYAMEISALSLDENVVTLQAAPDAQAGRPAVLSWSPPTRYFTVRNETVTRASGKDASVVCHRVNGSNVLVVRGSVGREAKPVEVGPVTIEDPALYAGTVLTALLQEAGITVDGPVRHGTLPEAGWQALYERRSATLGEILPRFLKPSDNHFGEQIVQTVRAEKAAATHQEAPDVESLDSEFVAQIGGESGGIRAVDGSGLSRLNLVTPETLVQALRGVRSQPYAGLFLAALPIAGKDGTLARRMRETPAGGNVHAKTGSINAVSCLSGYVTTAAGEPLVFSIMMNHFSGGAAEARAAQDRICVLLSELR